MRPIPRDQILTLCLVAPAFLYLAGLLLSGYQGWDGDSELGFLLVPLLLVVGLWPIYGALVELIGFLFVGIVATLGTATGALGPGGYDFAAGLLLASPFLLGVWAWGPGRTAPARLVGLGIALTEGLILLAALASIRANGGVENSLNLFSWYTEVNVQQLCGLANLLSVAPGGCPSLTVFPLRDIVDPVFVFLAGVAFLGCLMPVLTPRTARGDVGDAESWDEFESTSQVPADLPVTAEMMRGLALRTPPRSSPGLLPPGAGALLSASFFTLLFIGVAIQASSLLLLPTVVLVLGTLVAVIALDRPGARPAKGRLPRVEVAPIPATSSPGGMSHRAPEALPAAAPSAVVLP